MANQKVKTPKKRQFLFNPLKRPLPYIGFFIALLIILFQSSIRQYTANLVGGWLVNNIRESTEGNYLLEYDFVRFDIFTKELRIKNLDLSLDTARITEDAYLTHNNNLIYLTTPVVVLKIRSLWDLIYHDKLAIAYVGLQEPSVKLTRSEVISSMEKIENQQEATNAIRSYLQELEVDSFRILNGAVEVDLEDDQRKSILNFKIRDFTTLLKGFRLENIDSTKLFQGIYAEEFELELLDQELSIPQFKHEMAFERLWVSTADSIIRLDTLKINPLGDDKDVLKGNIGLNQLLIKGIDFERAYLKEELDIEKILLSSPAIDLKGKMLSNQVNKSAPDWLFMLFKNINIHEFNVIDGDLDLNLGKEYAFNDVRITVDNYRIDSIYTNVDNLRRELKDFHFEVSNAIIELPDSIHQLEIGKLHLSSTDSLAIINNIKMSPIPGRRSYQLYKKQGARLINYSSVKNIILSGVNYNQVINDGKLLADTLLLSTPNINITEYPYIRTKMSEGGFKPFLLKTVLLSDGVVKYNKRQGGQNHRSELSGVSVNVRNLYNEPENAIVYDTIDVQIKSGFSELKEMGHTLRFKGVKSRNLHNIDITQLSLSPDSAKLSQEKLDLAATFIRIRGFDERAFRNSNFIKVNTLTAQYVNFKGDLRNERTTINNSTQNQIKKAIINRFYIKNADFDLLTSDNELTFKDISASMDTINYNSEAMLGQSPLDFSDFTLTHGNFKIESEPNNLYLSGIFGQFKDSDSLINFKNVSIRNGENIKGDLRNLTLTGFHSRKLLNEKALKFNYLMLDRPDFEIASTSKKVKSSSNIFSPDSLQKKILSKLAYIEFESIVSIDATLKIASEHRTTELSGFQTHIGKYRLDSLSDPINIFKAENLDLTIDRLTTRGKNDTVNVQAITLDMVKNRLFTGEINITSHINTNHLKVKAPGLLISGFSAIELLNGDYTVDSIRMSGAEIVYVTPKVEVEEFVEEVGKKQKSINRELSSLFKKSGNLMMDTLLSVQSPLTPSGQKDDTTTNVVFGKLIKKLRNNLTKELEESEPLTTAQNDTLVSISVAKKAESTHGILKHLLVNNSTFTLQRDEDPHSYFSGLNFSVNVDTLVLDSLNKFNIYNHIHDLTVSINNYKINLPDSLNSFSFDNLRLSTGKEQLEIFGLAFTPLVNKYDYAPAKGHQAGWNYLHDIDLRLDKINLYKLINDKELHINKISTYNGVFDIFKDKTLPIPVNKRIAMPQDALKNLNLAVVVDSVEVENLEINFTSRINASNPEGSIHFKELHATVGNIVNTDSAIAMNPYIIVSATTKIQNQGDLSANFNFDLNDDDNGFIFDARLGAMEAQAFNEILEPTAFVKVESGKIKELKLEAQGDNYYATGNMRFEYNSLKVSTINRKNLKTTGMGKVIKTFFANAFVVKKNNPAFKFFPRDGAMYFERDPQKVVIDYVTKTAISGIVSSIGARDARKDIKRIQKESKKQKDDERKALKKAGKKSASD